MKLSTKQVFILLSILMRIGPCLTYASYGAFLARTLGLDPLLTNMVNQAFYIGMVVLEVPTGAVADKYGKRISYLVYCFFYALGSLVYFFSHNFLMAAFSEFILALGSTFQSGSFSTSTRAFPRLAPRFHTCITRCLDAPHGASCGVARVLGVEREAPRRNIENEERRGDDREQVPDALGGERCLDAGAIKETHADGVVEREHATTASLRGRFKQRCVVADCTELASVRHAHGRLQ